MRIFPNVKKKFCCVCWKVFRTKVIGATLCMTPQTVSRQLRNLCAKCGVRNSLHLLNATFPRPAAEVSPAELTPRENELLRLVMYGWTSREAGALLGISPFTVRKHRENILDKFAAHSMRQVVSLLIRRELPPKPLPDANGERGEWETSHSPQCVKNFPPDTPDPFAENDHPARRLLHHAVEWSQNHG